MKIDKKNQNIKNLEIKNSVNIILLLCLIIFFSNISFADIHINEVLYDPSITDNGGEAIELYNSGDEDVNISGYTIQTESSSADATLPFNSIIKSKGYFLIADVGWEESKDSLLFPFSDYEESLTLKNSDTGIILNDNQNNIIDLVGWGDAPDGFFSVKPSVLANETHSLQRVNFSGNNNIDFISSFPDLVNSQGENQDSSGNIFTIKLQIPSGDDYILDFSIDTDNGNEIYLMPGEIKIVKVYFEINNKFSSDEISLIFNNKSIPFSEILTKQDSKEYMSELNFDYFMLKGNYSLNLLLNDSNKVYDSVVNFSIGNIMAYEIDNLNFNCSLLDDNDCKIIGDSDMDTVLNPTIKNIGNVPLDFKIFSDTILETNKSLRYISDQNVKFSFDNINYSTLSSERRLFDVNLNPGLGASIPFSILLSNISKLESGEYSKQFVIMGVDSE